jgi:hypothetical protein
MRTIFTNNISPPISYYEDIYYTVYSKKRELTFCENVTQSVQKLVSVHWRELGH